MDNRKTPPIGAGQDVYSPPTPERTRRLEENRLKAKALHERQHAAEAAASTQPATTRTPSGFLVTHAAETAGAKRKHGTATSGSPATRRDARQLAPDDGVQPARKYKKYIDHDFSTMRDTKGGFLQAEDDPWNTAMGHGRAAAAATKPAHMTLAEWERHQVLTGLRARRAGPFEPGISLDARQQAKRCRECASLEIDWQWEEVFKCAVCGACKEKFPDKYSLLTKTEAKDDYLLTDPELKDPELLPHLNKPNPLKPHWHDMMLFMRYQVEEYAFNTKWGSAEALDAEFEKREADKKAKKEKKFKSKLLELKKKTRTDVYRRNNLNQAGGGQFGDKIGDQGRHEHEWGLTVEKADGSTMKRCNDCGMEVEELEF
ncbi:hypothetical protein K3495_g6370 [Podosphaera aphanis]|nr:hypothetical protein K3495_g6370 [Podosphaera aphanis]